MYYYKVKEVNSTYSAFRDYLSVHPAEKVLQMKGEDPKKCPRNDKRNTFNIFHLISFGFGNVVVVDGHLIPRGEGDV